MSRHPLINRLRNSAPALLLLLIMAGGVQAQQYVNKVEQGNKAYNAGEFDRALEAYHDAEIDLPESPQLSYNMAGVHYQKGEYEQAVEMYQKALNAPDAGLQEQTHYNLGNTYSRMGDFQNAIDQYQKALELNPEDMDAKFNLELARKMLKEQIKPEQQQDQQDQQKKEDEQEKEEQEQQQQQQQQQNKDDQQEEQSGAQEENLKEDQQQQQQGEAKPQDEQKMSKEDAERILNALKDDERDLQKQIRRDVRGDGYTGKDW